MVTAGSPRLVMVSVMLGNEVQVIYLQNPFFAAIISLENWWILAMRLDPVGLADSLSQSIDISSLFGVLNWQ